MSGFDVVAFTRDYEAWLGSRIPLVASDLRDKHTAMTDSTFRFLRGTYYLWLRRVADLVPDLLHHPAVPLIGRRGRRSCSTRRPARGPASTSA